MKPTKHEDDRRVLIEWVHDMPLRSCKVLLVKGDGVVGEHYHKKKEEIFYLLQGSGYAQLDDVSFTITAGDLIHVPKKVRHSFNLVKGSILLGGATKPYDKDDEYK